MNINDKIDSVFSKEFRLKSPSIDTKIGERHQQTKHKNKNNVFVPIQEVEPNSMNNSKVQINTDNQIEMKQMNKRLSLRLDNTFYNEFLEKIKAEEKKGVITILPNNTNNIMTHNSITNQHNNHIHIKGRNHNKPGMMKKEKSQGNIHNKNYLLFQQNQNNNLQNSMNQLNGSLKSNNTLKEEDQPDSTISKNYKLSMDSSPGKLEVYKEQQQYHNSINPRGTNFIQIHAVSSKGKKPKESISTSQLTPVEKIKTHKKPTKKISSKFAFGFSTYSISNPSHFNIINNHKKKLSQEYIIDKVMAFSKIGKDHHYEERKESNPQNIINNIIFSNPNTKVKAYKDENDRLVTQSSKAQKKRSRFCCL